MKLGIDIGGTHTDGVLIENNKIIESSKIATKEENLKKTILTTCQNLISNSKVDRIEKIVLSTTLVTNIIAKRNYKK